jgi:hypothetical protein
MLIKCIQPDQHYVSVSLDLHVGMGLTDQKRLVELSGDKVMSPPVWILHPQQEPHTALRQMSHGALSSVTYTGLIKPEVQQDNSDYSD